MSSSDVSVELSLDPAPRKPLVSFSIDNAVLNGRNEADTQNAASDHKVKCDLCKEHAQHSCGDCDRQLCDSCDDRVHLHKPHSAHVRTRLVAPAIRSRARRASIQVAHTLHKALGGEREHPKPKKPHARAPLLHATAMSPEAAAMSQYIITACLLLVALVVLGVILVQLKFVLVPFLLAMMLYLLLEPLVDLLTQSRRKLCWCQPLRQRLSVATRAVASFASCGADHGSRRYLCCKSLANLFMRLQMPGWAASIVAILVALGVLAFVCYIIVSAVTSIFDNVSQYSSKITTLVQGIVNLAGTLGFKTSTDDIIAYLKALPLADYAIAVISEILSIFATMAIMLIFILYLLMNRKDYVDRHQGLTLDPAQQKSATAAEQRAREPAENDAISDSAAPELSSRIAPLASAVSVGAENDTVDEPTLMEEIVTQVYQYIAYKSIIALITAVCVAIILLSLKAPLAGLFAILTFFFKFIPSVGALLTTVLPLPLIWLSPNHTTGDVFLALGLIQGVQMLIGEIIEPKLLGDGLALHPATVLFALLVWSSIWGIVGAFLAVPITSVVKIVCKQLASPIAQFVGQLLEGNIGVGGGDEDDDVPKNAPQLNRLSSSFLPPALAVVSEGDSLRSSNSDVDVRSAPSAGAASVDKFTTTMSASAHRDSVAPLSATHLAAASATEVVPYSGARSSSTTLGRCESLESNAASIAAEAAAAVVDGDDASPNWFLNSMKIAKVE